MAKRPKMPRDPNQLAAKVLRIATGEEPKPGTEPDTRNPAAVELGRKGGLKGGKARAEKLSAKQRSDIAAKAAKTRWGNKG